MIEIGPGLVPIGLGGFDEAVEHGARLGAPGTAGEQPVLASDDERADGVLGFVVVDL